MRNNYFVCTLGQAAGLQSQAKTYHNISDFLRKQSQHYPSLPAVGFPIPQLDQTEWKHGVLNFQQVDRGTDVFASRLAGAIGAPNESNAIALICHSSPEFLFTWLGLLRLGYSVLLIAPQCQPAAIQHLCKSCNVSILLYDTAHADRAQKTSALEDSSGDQMLRIQPLPITSDEDIFEVIEELVERSIDPPHVNEKAIAYLHHTSGTSSGLPKPIPQSHRAAIGVLPHLPTTPSLSSFTTTPLYHGGIADLFRCWTSNALIWLFPGKDVPITARSICNCLSVASTYSSTKGQPDVRYFSSVPYVLQMMETDDTGLKFLQSMDIVGVGGAALPAEVGDRLVARGVNLISRFGSAECGFILSSYRDFASDNDWQYLRNYNPPKLLEFEPRDDGLAELVIKPGWPHMAKQNREDGSYATADLFTPHASIPNAWLYHSRADSQLTLITGKKFDPAPLEDAIATSPHLADVLIFGNSRPYPGALLLRSEQAKDKSDQELLDVVKPVVHKLNSESQDHARISFDMLIPVPYQDQPLEKSSKGTLIRKVAETRFQKTIEAAYSPNNTENIDGSEVKDEDVPMYLINLIQSTTSQSEDLSKDMDLFSYGVDSIACMQLRTRLRRLIPGQTDTLPMSIIEDCGTIERLTQFILHKRHGEVDASQEDEEQTMLDLVKQYGTFTESPSEEIANDYNKEVGKGEIVLITGATGALGAHMLDVLLETSNVQEVYCLVRGADEHAAKERVSKALEQRGLTSLSSSNTSRDKVRIVPAQLSDKQLGLSDELYVYLAKHATSIIHVAWTVNFRLKLRSFEKDNIAGVRHLLDLALHTPRQIPPRFAYCSSTASIMNGPLDPSGTLPERLLSDPASASPLGYSRSKWVAEHICAAASKRTNLDGHISIVRVGQLSGDSSSGVWNAKEAWPMMLSTVRLIGCLPDLKDEPLDWLPVDIAAKAFVETAFAERGVKNEPPVYHVLNPHRTPVWRQMLEWLQKYEDFEIVSPKEWVRKLEEAREMEHSALKLLGLWKDAYAKDAQAGEQRPKFAMDETRMHVPTLRDVQPLDEEYVRRMWQWIQANVK